MHQHGGANADRVALHGGKQRRLAARQRVQKVQDRRPGCAASSRHFEKIADVVAGAEHRGGAPAISRQHSAGLCAVLSMPPAMASYIAIVSAFFFSGRFIRTVRTGPASVTMTRSAMALFRQRGIRVRDAFGAFGDAAFEAGGLRGDILGKETGQCYARRAIAAFA